MEHAISIADMQDRYLRQENILIKLLEFLFGLPVALVRMISFVLVVRWVNRLSRSIIRLNEKFEIYTTNRQVLEESEKKFAELLPILKKYKMLVSRVRLPKIFLLDGAITELNEIVSDFEDLHIAYLIFLEPVERDYPLKREFAMLRAGRERLRDFYNQDFSDIRGDTENTNQMIFSNEVS